MPRTKVTVLVVDDEAAICEVLETRLQSWGYDVVLARDGTTARQLVRDADPDLVLSDVSLPDANGLELLEALRGADGRRPVLLMTAYGTIDVAVEAMKRGATDFLTKPLDPARLKATLARLEEAVEFRRATATAGEEEAAALGALVGRSAAMRELAALVKRVAATDTAVLISGESGTGKEVVARTLHALSRRARAPLVALNMAALPEGVVESELFGHARGSFTGAVASRPGAFELAHTGTLFLDELAEMPIALQPKLLRVLEDGSFRPLGAREERRVDVRVLAATNRVPETAVAEGRLREDLFYRLNVITLVLPPLRERRGDVPILARHFLGQFGARHGTQVTEIDDDALEALSAHGWPGNVRELRNVIERALVLARDGRLRREDLPPALRGAGETTPGPVVLPPNVTAAEAERILILETLRQAKQNKAEAARRLGMDVKTIRNKLKAYGLMADAE